MFVKFDGKIWFIDDMYDDVLGNKVIVLLDIDTGERIDVYAEDVDELLEDW